MTYTSSQGVWGNFVAMAQQHLQGVEWSFNGTISMLRRRWTVLAGCVSFAVLIAIVMLVLIPPRYTASALMQINTRQEQVTKFDDLVTGLTASDQAIRTEVDIITSRKLAGRVVNKMNLANSAELAQNAGVVGMLFHAVKYFLFPLQTEEAETQRNANSAESNAHSRAIDNLLNNLNVQVRPRSYSIALQYTAYSPEMAQKVANAVADEYLNSQLEDRFEATRRANDWMNERVRQMQKKVQESELAVQKFREQHGFTEAKGILLSEQQISELNSQLILARTQLAEAEAKFGRAKQLQASGRGIESAAEVLNSPLIMNLRGQETEIRRNMSELASRYGERHPRMVNVRNELRDLQRKIYEEITKIQGSLENEVAVAQARVATLEQQLQALQDKTSLSTDANVQLAELERQAEAEKAMYESLLSRSKELAQMDFVQTDARIISPADLPLNPSSPRKALVLALAVILGLGTGIGLMLALEALDSGFRTSQQVENITGMPVLGLLGELPHDTDIPNYVVSKPTSAFSEGIRSIRTSLQFANPDKNVQVVMITSSVPQEGKSLFAISMAQLAASAGLKTLLVDADLRRPSAAKQLDLNTKAGGLAEVLIGKAKLKDVIHVLPKNKLHVVPAIATTQFAQELISSQKFKDLLTTWRKEYDLIVLDCPPVMAVADAISISALADAALFVIRWGTTPRPLVANSIKQAQSCNMPLAGCVITRVDLEKQHAYGYGDYGYYYGKYKEYYHE